MNTFVMKRHINIKYIKYLGIYDSFLSKFSINPFSFNFVDAVLKRYML